MIDIQTFFAETQSCSPLVLEWTAISTSGPHEMTDPRPLPAKTAAIPGLASEHGWIAEVYAYPGGLGSLPIVPKLNSRTRAEHHSREAVIARAEVICARAEIICALAVNIYACGIM